VSVSPSNDERDARQDWEGRLRDVESRVDTHEAVCSERYKQIFNQLKSTDSLIRTIGVLLVGGMAGVIISQVLP
jgi:hypothetical protein